MGEPKHIRDESKIIREESKHVMDKPKHVNETHRGQNKTYQRLTNTCQVQPDRDEQKNVNSQLSRIQNVIIYMLQFFTVKCSPVLSICLVVSGTGQQHCRFILSVHDNGIAMSFHDFCEHA